MKKTVLTGLALIIALAGCSMKDNNVNTHDSEISYKQHIKNVKKLRKKNKQNKEAIDLDKFCFKDSRSIHYKASEKCK